MSVSASTQLHIVTGKGGTGKTTIAAALAMSLARQRRRVLLCEVEGRQGLAQLFDVPPLPYAERKVAVVPGGGEVFALAIDPEAALLEYLQMFYRLGRAGKALDKFGIIDFATTIAPGVRDVLLTGKVYEVGRRRGRENSGYDAIVMDAPPTGRISRFLNVNSELAGLAKVGPVKKQADAIMTMMRSPSTRVHFVTLLEEMPVTETVDQLAVLRQDGLRTGHIVVNRQRPDLLSESTQAELTDEAAAVAAVSSALASVDLPPSAAEGLVTQGRRSVERVALEQAQREVLVASEAPLIDIPRLASGIDLGSLYEIADLITSQYAEQGGAA